MSRLKKVMLSFLFVVVLAGIASVVVFQQLDDKQEAENGERTIDDIVDNSYETSEITTNLDDGTFVRIQFQLVTDGQEATEEVAKREFQFKNILIKEMSVMTEPDFKEGLTQLESDIKSKLNEEMTDGTITNVYTISKVLQ